MNLFVLNLEWFAAPLGRRVEKLRKVCGVEMRGGVGTSKPSFQTGFLIVQRPWISALRRSSLRNSQDGVRGARIFSRFGWKLFGFE